MYMYMILIRNSMIPGTSVLEVSSICNTLIHAYFEAQGIGPRISRQLGARVPGSGPICLTPGSRGPGDELFYHRISRFYT